MSVEAESLQMMMSALSSAAQFGRTSAEAAKQLLENLIKAVRFAKSISDNRISGKVKYKTLASNNEVGFLFLKDGKTTEESKKKIKDFEKDLKKMGVLFSVTNFDPAPNGVPSGYGFRASDKLKIEALMATEKYKDLISFNTTPEEKDFDPKLVDSNDLPEGVVKSKEKTVEGETASSGRTKLSEKAERAIQKSEQARAQKKEKAHTREVKTDHPR